MLRSGPRYAQHDGETPSYYEASAVERPAWPTLTADRRADVAIVGGGYTGLSAALHLAEWGYDTVLLEARRVGGGASGRNGGQLGSGQRRIQTALEAELGMDAAQALWALAEEAKACVKALIAQHRIACDLKPGIIHAAHRARHAGFLARYAAHLHTTYRYQAIEPLDKAALAGRVATTRYHGGYVDTGAAHLHPLNYALGLGRAASAAGAAIHEQAAVETIGSGPPWALRASGHTVCADRVLLACNGYLDRLVPRIAGRIMPINNYILATAPLGDARAHALIPGDEAVSDTKFVIDYYRLSADRRLLFGGGESYSRSFPRDLKGFVRRRMLRVFPQLADVGIDHAWGGTLAITRARMPSFGRAAPELYYAQGYSGHGVGMASFAGKLVAEAIAGTAERFDVFARLPQPAWPGGTLLRWPLLVLGMRYYALRDLL